MTEKKYPIGFSIALGSFTDEELQKNNYDPCESLLIQRQVTKDGNSEVTTIGIGPDHEPLPVNELFMFWFHFGLSLNQLEDLSPALKLIVNSFCRITDEIKKEIIKQKEEKDQQKQGMH
jgi:hypothetical protein